MGSSHCGGGGKASKKGVPLRPPAANGHRQQQLTGTAMDTLDFPVVDGGNVIGGARVATGREGRGASLSEGLRRIQSPRQHHSGRDWEYQEPDSCGCRGTG
jgi:hypothetical protein